MLWGSMIYAQDDLSSSDWRNISLNDTLRLQLLDSLIDDVYWTKQPDSSLILLEEMVRFARSIDYGTYIRRGLRRRAQLYANLGDYNSAIPANKERIAAYEAADYDTIKRFRALAASHRELAYSLRKVGQTVESLEQYEIAFRYAESIGEAGLKEKSSSLNSLGSLYYNLRNYELAREKYLASLAIKEAIDDQKGIYNALNNLGLVATQTGDYEQALVYFENSLAMKIKAGDKKRMANTYGNIGEVLLIQGREEEAGSYFLQAKNLQEELGLRDELTRSLTQLGELAIRQGQPERAVSYCSDACTIATEDDLWQASLACQRCLYEAYRALGNFREALLAHEAYMVVKDSIFSEENAREIAALEARLTYEKQLAEAQTEQVRLEQESKQERLLRWILAGSTAALALLSWFALRTVRLRRRQNQILQDKNQQIAEDSELIQQQAAELAEVVAIKDQFFTNISHELRTPLTLVISPLEKLLQENKELPESVIRNLKTAQGNADKLLELVEQLLELSKLEAGSISPDNKTVELQTFIRRVFENHQPLADDKNIQFDLLYEAKENLVIETDPGRLEKVIDNLIRNALKFTPNRGRVSLSVNQSPDNHSLLEFTVEDTGPGIQKQYLSKIFDRYFQIPDQSEGGSGIGLALAQESAQLLGGQLSVKSELQDGTSFTLKLPVKSSPEVFRAADTIARERYEEDFTVPAPRAVKHSQRILIVEDNQELQNFITEVLSDYPCSTASDGRAALQMLRQAKNQNAPFALIITDLMMPGMDGATLIRHVKEDSNLASTHLVVLTAKNDLSEKLTLLRIGVDDYLTKPFSTAELAIRVSSLLKHKIEVHHEADSFLQTQGVKDSEWLHEVEQVVERLLDSRQQLTANALANAMNISNRQLLRKIKALTGLSTQLYLQECKLQLAQRYLLQNRYSNVNEVARACGFTTLSYFKKVFQERFGRPPIDLLRSE